MGAACSLDASPLSIDEVIGFVAPPGAPPPAAHRSNLKVWRFFTTQGATDVGSAPLSLAGFAGFSAVECYVLLHVYRRRDGTTRKRKSVKNVYVMYLPIVVLFGPAELLRLQAVSQSLC